MSWTNGPYCEGCKVNLAGTNRIRLIWETVSGEIRSRGGKGLKKKRETLAVFCSLKCLLKHTEKRIDELGL